MTKPATVRRFEAEHDKGPTATLKPGSFPADLAAVEDLLGLKLPAPVAHALGDYVFGVLEVEPRVGARRAAAEAAKANAVGDQRAADAEAVAKVIGKGPDAFGDLAAILHGVDIVLEAETNLAEAERLLRATRAANDGRLRYLVGLVSEEYREAFLDVLDDAWRRFVLVKPTDSTTLGELSRLEGVAAESRRLVERLLLVVEGSNRSGGFTPADAKTLRAAVRSEEWDVLPTLERVNARAAEAAANSPSAKRAEVAAAALKAKRQHDKETAAASAMYRRGLRVDETAENSETTPVPA